MSEGVNKVILVGNIGAAPERVKVSWPLLKFNIAVTEVRPKADGKWQKQTQWLRCTLSGKRVAVFEKRLQKGTRIYIEGRLNVRSYDDKNGERRWITEIEIVGNPIILAKGKDQGDQGDSEEESRTEQEASQEGGRDGNGNERAGADGNDEEKTGYDDDLPF